LWILLGQKDLLYIMKRILLVKKIVETSQNDITKIAYKTPDHFIINGTTYLETLQGKIPLAIFGIHNLQNLAGAKTYMRTNGH